MWTPTGTPLECVEYENETILPFFSWILGFSIRTVALVGLQTSSDWVNKELSNFEIRRRGGGGIQLQNNEFLFDTDYKCFHICTICLQNINRFRSRIQKRYTTNTLNFNSKADLPWTYCEPRLRRITPSPPDDIIYLLKFLTWTISEHLILGAVI